MAEFIVGARNGNVISVPDFAILNIDGLQIIGDQTLDWNEPIQKNFLALDKKIMAAEETTIQVVNDTGTALGLKADKTYVDTQDTASINAAVVAAGTYTDGVKATLTKADVGLGNVDNTTDLLKPVSTATQNALDLKSDKFDTLAGYGITDAINVSQKGIANGVATLDSNGTIPAGQLPSYVDDVLEYVNLAGFPLTGEVGKIYVAKDSNKTYRWSGTVYIYVSGGVSIVEEFIVAVGGETVITIPNSGSYAVGTKQLEVFCDGLRWRVGKEYTETSTTSITVASVLSANEEVIFRITKV